MENTTNPLVLLSLLLVAVVATGALELSHGKLAGAPRADCVIELDVSSQWPNWPPVITDANDDPVFPEGRFDLDDRHITVAEGEELRLSCSGGAFAEFPGEEFATARCVGGSQFTVATPGNPNAGSLPFADLGCAQQPDSNSVAWGVCADGVSTDLDLGFETEAGHLEVVSVCFDEDVSMTRYSRAVMYANIVGRDTSNDTPSFRPDGYFPFDVNQAYTQVQQQATISDLVGSDALGAQYVRVSENIFLARGHLSANADHVFYSWQDATYYFVNVAPQWQCFNGGNWVYLENGVRDFVEERAVDLVIYTGTSGVLALPDVNGDDVEIWLNPADGRLPVPLFYWKILVDLEANTGVAFVGVNNPHLNANEIAAHKVCEPLDNHPIMDNIFYPDDVIRGVTYACLVEDLAAVFPEVPVGELGNLGLLM